MPATITQQLSTLRQSTPASTLSQRVSKNAPALRRAPFNAGAKASMRRILSGVVIFAGVLWYQVPLEVHAAQIPPAFVEIAVVANAEAGTVALVDVASRSVLGAIDVNPAHAKAEGPGRPNYAQDTDVSLDGRMLYASRGYLGDVAAFDIASARLLWRRSLNTGRADHMTITPDGRNLFVSALMDNRVYKLSTSTGEIAGHLVTGVYPHDVKVSKDGLGFRGPASRSCTDRRRQDALPRGPCVGLRRVGSYRGPDADRHDSRG